MPKKKKEMSSEQFEYLREVFGEDGRGTGWGRAFDSCFIDLDKNLKRADYVLPHEPEKVSCFPGAEINPARGWKKYMKAVFTKRRVTFRLENEKGEMFETEVEILGKGSVAQKPGQRICYVNDGGKTAMKNGEIDSSFYLKYLGDAIAKLAMFEGQYLALRDLCGKAAPEEKAEILREEKAFVDRMASLSRKIKAGWK